MDRNKRSLFKKNQMSQFTLLNRFVRDYMLIGFVLLSVCMQGYSNSRVLELRSPGNKLGASIMFDATGQLIYHVVSSRDTLIHCSKMGLLMEGITLGTEVEKISLLDSVTLDEQYEIKGKHTVARNHSNAYTIRVDEGSRSFNVLIRLFDDGMAFRYVVDGIDNAYTIQGELSSFKFPENSTVWFFERKNEWKLKSYAGEWISADLRSMQTVSPTGPIQGKPLIVQLANRNYICLTEAHLENYSGMRLKATDQRTFAVDFTEGQEGFEIGNSHFQTPWRVVLFAENLRDLVDSDIITNLNPAPDPRLFSDQSYIKPGKSVWSWITKDSTYMTVTGEQHFIDYAHELGFEYTMIDEGWESKWTDKWQTLRDLCDYGQKKNVGVWVWRHSNRLMDELERKLFLDSVENAGAVGIKVDFMNSEAKKLIDFEIALLKDCAERRLMVNFHGCQSPSGESRTYPNEMTREGVRGMELNIMEEGPISACHNAALPFTRFVVGHGDYTPGFFSKPGNTTWGHQFATMYLFDSPFMCMAEHPKFILDHPNLRQIVPYLREMPVVWDETVVLDNSDIGKLAVLAKRKAAIWYIMAINGESIEKKLNINLDFIPKKGYTVEMVSDKHGREKSLEKTSIKLEKGVLPALRIEPNGGIVLRLTETARKKL